MNPAFKQRLQGTPAQLRAEQRAWQLHQIAQRILEQKRKAAQQEAHD